MLLTRVLVAFAFATDKQVVLVDTRTKGQDGRAMAQAVSRRPPTAEARVRSRVSPCGICGGQCGTGTGFSPSYSVFTRLFHSTGALLGKGQKIIIFTFIIGLQNKPHGCSASIASAAGPFTTKRKRRDRTQLRQWAQKKKFRAPSLFPSIEHLSVVLV
jgi:hypothetical protein